MKELILAPSILSADFATLGDDIRRTAEAGAKYIHIDVMDGQFVNNISFGSPIIKSVRKVTDAVFDVHLMVQEPERVIEQFINSGADIITVHQEACVNPDSVLDKIKAAGIKTGISINPDTPVSAILPYLNKVDMVLVMSVVPGKGGQSYMPVADDKIKELTELRAKNGYDYDIEVDGGIKQSNIQAVAEKGANIFVAGSAVFIGDIEANTKAFINLLEQKA